VEHGEMMSECFVCQRTEGVVELPLGPFCVCCINEIAKYKKTSDVKKKHRDTDWNAMWTHIASMANSAPKKAEKTEWENYFSNAAATANSRAIEQPKRDASKKGRKAQTLSWADFWSKRAYEASQRSVYTLTQSDWNKKWDNAARMIYSRHRARLEMTE